MKRTLLLTLVAAVAACDGCSGGDHVDAAVIGDGPCGVDMEFTGEIVDWDATDAMFCGVFMATVTAHSDATRTNKSNPNGRFDVCLPRAATAQVDITPPVAASMCGAAGIYQIPGIMIANQQVIGTMKLFSARMLGMNRLTPFFTGVGVTYDPAKATVFVHVEGTSHPVTISAAHDTTLAWSGTAWAAGDSGVDVVFPNTDVGSGTTMVGVTGGSAIGTGAIPVVANTFTYVTIVGQ